MIALSASAHAGGDEADEGTHRARAAALAAFARAHDLTAYDAPARDVVDPTTVDREAAPAGDLPRGEVIAGPRGLADGERVLALADDDQDGVRAELVFVSDRRDDTWIRDGECVTIPRYAVFARRGGGRVVARLVPRDRVIVRRAADCRCQGTPLPEVTCRREGPTIPMHGVSLGRVPPRGVEIVDVAYPVYRIEDRYPERCRQERCG